MDDIKLIFWMLKKRKVFLFLPFLIIFIPYILYYMMYRITGNTKYFYLICDYIFEVIPMASLIWLLPLFHCFFNQKGNELQFMYGIKSKFLMVILTETIYMITILIPVYLHFTVEGFVGIRELSTFYIVIVMSYVYGMVYYMLSFLFKSSDISFALIFIYTLNGISPLLIGLFDFMEYTTIRRTLDFSMILKVNPYIIAGIMSGIAGYILNVKNENYN